jgi:SulP family sulfate permease
LQHNPIPAGVTVFRIHGPFLFGATTKLQVIYDRLPDLPPIVVLRLRNMTAIDATGLGALEDLADCLSKSGRKLMLCGIRDQPAKFMAQAEFQHRIGEENIVPSLRLALERAKALVPANEKNVSTESRPMG